jgi:hypothetical protein
VRIRNLSNVGIDRDLMRSLARPFERVATRGALPDHPGRYPPGSLLVTVRPRLRRRSAHPQGTYTTGRIALFPCQHCSADFLVAIYLHELFHAWVSQVDDHLYLTWNHCATANGFADTAFRLLGGTWQRNERCTTYRIQRVRRKARLDLYERFVSGLIALRGEALKRWQPAHAARRLRTA